MCKFASSLMFVKDFSRFLLLSQVLTFTAPYAIFKSLTLNPADKSAALKTAPIAAASSVLRL